MSKRSKEDKLVEQLEAKIRELKQENKTLHKRLSRVNKGYYKYLIEDFENETSEEEVKKKEKKEELKLCFVCNVGYLNKVLILNRYWRECSNPKCDNRTKVKVFKNGEWVKL